MGEIGSSVFTLCIQGHYSPKSEAFFVIPQICSFFFVRRSYLDLRRSRPYSEGIGYVKCFIMLRFVHDLVYPQRMALSSPWQKGPQPSFISPSLPKVVHLLVS